MGNVIKISLNKFWEDPPKAVDQKPHDYSNTRVILSKATMDNATHDRATFQKTFSRMTQNILTLSKAIDTQHSNNWQMLKKSFITSFWKTRPEL